MFFVSIFLVWIVKFLTTQALLTLILSGWEFDETEKLTNFDGSLFSIAITFETNMLRISPFNLSLCALSSDISVASDPVPNKAHILTQLVLLWIVTGMICRYVL